MIKKKLSHKLKMPYFQFFRSRFIGLSNPKGINISLVICCILLTSITIYYSIYGISKEITISVTSIRHESGFAYTFTLPTPDNWLFNSIGDTMYDPNSSKAKIFENDRPLGPEHSIHESIRTIGKGRFSHWYSTLYFSSSDNSDPLKNDRAYRLVTNATLPSWIIWVLTGCFCIPYGFSQIQRHLKINCLRHNLRLTLNEFNLKTTISLFSIIISVCCIFLFGTSSYFEKISFPSFLLPMLITTSMIIAMLVGWEIGANKNGGSQILLEKIKLIKPIIRLASAIDQAFFKTGLQGQLLRMTSLILPFALYAVIFDLPLPTDFLIDSYYSLAPIALPFGVLIYIANKCKNWTGTLTGLTLTLILFALPLMALWHHVAINISAVGGLLPFSDASDYYFDARRLLDGHLFGWSSRRPLFAGMLATLLGITGQNLQMTLSIFVAMNAVACFLLAREIRNSHGSVSAVIIIIFLFLFYRVEGGLGTTMSENLGFGLGIVSFAVIWRGARIRLMSTVWFGLALMTLSLCARAGAFFVLPTMLIAGGWAFRGDLRYSFRFFIGAGTAIAIGFGLNMIVGKILSDPGGAQGAFSNFSYTLYGLIVGGKGWQQVLIDHPQVQEGKEIYLLAMQAFLANPMDIVKGSLKMCQEYFSGANHAFSFIRSGGFTKEIQLACYVLSAIGFVVCLRLFREPQYILLAAAAIGHFASIPFAPPIDAGLRIYASTIPILAILIAIGSTLVVNFIAKMAPMPKLCIRQFYFESARSIVHRSSGSISTSVIFGLTMAVFILIGPIVIRLTSQPQVLFERSCPFNKQSIYVRLTPGSLINIVKNSDLSEKPHVVVPDIRVSDLRKTADIIEIKNDADKFVSSNIMMNTYDLKSGRYVWLIAPSRLMPEEPCILNICGQDSTNAQSRKYGVFYADSINWALNKVPN